MSKVKRLRVLFVFEKKTLNMIYIFIKVLYILRYNLNLSINVKNGKKTHENVFLLKFFIKY